LNFVLILTIIFWSWSTFKLLLVKKDPSATLAWLLFVTIFPIVGPIFFLIFGRQRLERKAIKRETKLEKLLLESSIIFRDYTAHDSQQNLTSSYSEQELRVLKLVSKVSDYEATTGNQVEILTDPIKALSAMQKAILQAKHYIHLEYYIIANDEVTEQLFSSLISASERGVQVRILYDALGSISLKKLTFRKITKKGIKTASFLPFSFIPQRMNFNFRNHRKILIVDGTIAFTGGSNIGKSYLGQFFEKQWRDTVIKVEGPVCLQLQDVFAKDWYYTTKEDLFSEPYYFTPKQYGESTMQVLESGPTTQFHIFHNAIFLAINSAQKSIYLTTPYFIPDPAIQSSLIVSALRGVNVKLLLPAKSDAKLVQYASRSFYDELLGAGISIYEYQPRNLHSKHLVIDDKLTIIGSGNMDIRSFKLNFELNLIILGASVANQLIEIFNNDILDSVKITSETFNKRKIPSKLIENACRLLSPIL